MKRKLVITSLCLFGLVSAGQAQMKKSAVLLGADLSYGVQKNEYNNGSNLKSANIGFSVGKFFTESKVFGIIANYGFNSQRINSNDSLISKTDNYNLGVFCRHYKALGKGFYFFGQSAATYGQTKQDLVQSITKSKGLSINLTPGISYQVFKKLQMEITLPSIAYLNIGSTNYVVKNDPSFNYKTNTFSIGSSIIGSTPLNNLSLGVRLIL